MESIGTGSGGYCVTLAYPIPLLPSGPGGVFELQLHSPPKPVQLSGVALKRREWDSNPRWSYPHTRFPSVLLKPLGHLSRTFRLYHRFRHYIVSIRTGCGVIVSNTFRRSAVSFPLSIRQNFSGYCSSFESDFCNCAAAPLTLPWRR